MDATDDNKNTVLSDITKQCLECFARVVASHDAELLTRSIEPHEGTWRKHGSFDFLDLQRSFFLWIRETQALSPTESSLDRILQGLPLMSQSVSESLGTILRSLRHIEDKIESGTFSADEACAPAKQDFLQSWDLYCQGIDIGIGFLDRTADDIKKHSAQRLEHRMTTTSDSEFGKEIVSLVQRRFPSAGIALCRQLGDSITIRREKLIDKRRNWSARTDHTKVSLPDPRGPSLERLDEPPEKAPTTLMSNTSTDQQDSLDYPPLPTIAPGKTHVRCRLCCMKLKMEGSEEENTNHWRRHIDEDVKPYGCLFPECSKSLRYFVHRHESESHMLSAHYKDWLRNVHASTWFCDLGHSPPVKFKTELLWKEHILDSRWHTKGERRLTKLQLDDLSSRKQLNAPRGQFACPLCERVPDELSQTVAEGNGDPDEMNKMLVSHVASHIKSLSLMAILSVEESAKKITDTENDSLVSQGIPAKDG
ncbi:hypothetical protein FPSE_00743 [Fusarium pseudograminearum CS3096]|uniref:C2H2-type domain-containing protein n=2 Tax=Fusarium pseudograminearum TaxID=101028 RepID=K3VTH6_FUSPC|nr:hypothetical protein FPSE_00743 [Fusarium pseudograminearum CS3096]EKJ79142.1 hypothetical protein FPSE_00743 [Fusarium pseudograminearum CS3096]